MTSLQRLVSGIAALTAACSGAHDKLHDGAPADGASTDTGDAAVVSPTLGMTWTAAAGNPLIGDGTCPGWHCSAAGDPALAHAPDGSLVVWFTTVGVAPDGKGGFVSSINIGRATAADADPPAFAIAPAMPVIGSPTPANAWDAYIETVTVLHDDAAARWRMWFLGYATAGLHMPAIGAMESDDVDGTMWTRPAAPIYEATPGAWDDALVTGPTVMVGPDAVYRLYYSGVSTATGATGVGLLTSTDGATWTAAAGNPVFPAAAPGAWDSTILEHSVRYAAGRYWMLYSAYDGALTNTTSIAIGLATSPDGLHWTRAATAPVLAPGAAGTWDDLRIVAPDFVVEPDGSFLLAAYGQSTTDPAAMEAGRFGIWRSR